MKAKGKGFSLLEAIVAMTILATSGLALFSWFSVSYDGLIRLEEIQENNEVMDDLYAYFATLNIQEETAREIEINGYKISWRANLIEPKQQGRSLLGGLSNFDLGLYMVSIEVKKRDQLIGDFHIRRVGYQRVRDVRFE